MTKSMISPTRVIAALVLLFAIGIAFFPPVEPGPAAKALALTVFTIGFWATGILPEYLTALVFFTLAMLFSVSPAGTIFSGFQSSVFWLVFGGLILGVAIKRTGLGERIANHLSARFGRTYVRIITGMVTIGLALSFIMPSAVGRIVLLLPIANAMAGRFGFEPGSQGRTGIVLAAGFGSFFPAFAILPANVPNLVLTGAAETLYHFTPAYGEYLLLHFPVLGILKSIIIIALILLLYPDRPRVPAAAEAAQGAMTADEKLLAWVLVMTISFWVSDFMHHISPAWIGLAAGIVCLLPVVGLVSRESFTREINYGTLFFLAGIIGFGGMLSHSGLGNMLAQALLAVLPLEPGKDLLNFASLSITAMFIGIVANLPSVPAVLTPLAGEMAKAAGMSVESVLMTQVVGFSLVLLPYQAPPMVLTVQLGGVKTSAVVKFCALLIVSTLIILLPLDFLWWRLIGWI